MHLWMVQLFRIIFRPLKHDQMFLVVLFFHIVCQHQRPISSFPSASNTQCFLFGLQCLHFSLQGWLIFLVKEYVALRYIIGLIFPLLSAFIILYLLYNVTLSSHSNKKESSWCERNYRIYLYLYIMFY